VDFSTQIDNTNLGPTYVKPGFTFTQLGAAPPMFANATAGQIGLQFPDAGLEIQLGDLAYEITIVLGTFAGPVTLETRDSLSLLSTQTINTANTYKTMVIKPHACVSKLIFYGGHNEAILVQICVKWCSTAGPKIDPPRKTTRPK